MIDWLNRPPVHEDGGRVFYRASALGGCMRLLALARQGYEPLDPPANMLEVFKAGHEAERQVWRKHLVQGRAQERVELQISKNIWVVGHLDSWEPDKIHEVKSQIKDEYELPVENILLWQRYKFQIGAYMWATGLPLVLMRVLRDKTGNVLDHKTQQFDVPPVSMADIRVRVFQVESLARRDLTDIACDAIQYPCPFFYTHQDRHNIREYVDDAGAVVLAEESQKATAAARVAKEKASAAKKALYDWMGSGRDKVELPGGWKLTKYEVKARHVEYDAAGYEAVRVTPPREDSDG